jgi:protein involved in polysaccharide export with SLBB domain
LEKLTGVRFLTKERNLLHKSLFGLLRNCYSRFCVAGAFLPLVVLISCSHLPDKFSPAASSAGSGKQEIYHIRAGDVVQVDVFQEPIMTTRQRVLGDGTIFVGLVGRVNVLGESVEEAADKIGAILNQKQLVNPQVTLTILAYAPRRFTVWGQVKAAGTYVIPPEETMDLPDAIAVAGGNTVIGSLKRVTITRKIGDSVQRIQVNAQTEQGQLFEIQEGDVIFVPESIF